MEIRRRDFIKLSGLLGIGSFIPFNTQEGSPYNQWKPLAPSRLEKAESVCPLCNSFCKVEILKKRENIFSISNKDKKGLCPKIYVYHNIIYNENRIKTPLIRKGERGKISFDPTDYDKAINILKEKFKKEKFFTIANTKGEADKYYLNSISHKINFYPECYLKSSLGVDRVYFDIANADLVLNFGGDITTYGDFIDTANYLSNSAKKVISFSPIITKGSALGEKWIPVSIANIPYIVEKIASSLNQTVPNFKDLEENLGLNESDFLELITKIKSSKKICVAFPPTIAETIEGVKALNSIIILANSLKAINKEGGTFFYNNPIGSKPFNILNENITNLLIYNIDPLLTDYYINLIDRLKNISFIVYIGSHHSEISKYADLIIPLSFFVEKDEIYLKKDKMGFSALISSPAVEGGVEAIELRKKENIELIFQKLLNFKAPYGIKDISDIARELDNKLLARKAYITSLLKGIKISSVNPQLIKKEFPVDSNLFSLYLYEDGILDFTTRGSKWAEEFSHLNRALINKNIALKLGVKDGDFIEIKTETNQIKLKCFIFDGIADNTIGLKKYKVPADINKYTNKNLKYRTNDKEIDQIWWKNEDVPVNTIFKAIDGNFPLFSCKVVSIKKI